ncbi:hypothetical protein WJX79_002789 [Trebouxia sp. C0005]
MPKEFLKLRVIPGEEAPVKELVDVYVANIAAPQASQLVKLLGQIAPLGQFDHLKRVSATAQATAADCQGPKACSSVPRTVERLEPDEEQRMHAWMDRAFTLGEANEAAGGVCNAAVIVNPVSGKTIAEGQDGTKQHPLRHAIMAAIDAAAARDRRLWPSTGTDTRETSAALSAAHKPSLPSHSIASDNDATESDLPAKRRRTSAAGSFHETSQEEQRLSVGTQPISPGLSPLSSSLQHNPVSSTNHPLKSYLCTGMSVSALLPRHIFGLRGDVKDNIHFVEENTIIYPVGHTVVSYNVETKVQRFTPGSPESEGITALAVSPNKKFLAVAERSDKGTISVYDLQTLKRRKVLVSSETGAKEIASMAFSPDGRLLAAQGGSPEWNLVLWVWEKSKVVTSVKTTNATGNPVYQCLFNPGAAGEGNGIISVIGSGIFKCFKTAENSLKLLTSALAKREPQNYMAHCWLSEGERERMVLGTDSGELLIIEGTELKATLQLDPGSTVLSIAAYSKGFMVGSDGGTLFLFERDGEGAARTYRKTKTLVVQGQPVKIRNLAVSPTEDTLLCTLENNQMYSLNLTNTELMKQDEMNFELVTQSFHSSEILSIDACVRKPIVASVSSDHTVRLWNFLDKSTELVKNFTEDAYSVSLHPSGLIVLLGFADKLRLMTVLMDDFRLIKEFSMKACKECRFSHGGHYFAAVNGNTISIYNTYTFENVGNLRGHNGKVRSLAWLPDDTKLVSAGVDGAVYEWRLKDFKRSKENVLKGCSYSCVVDDSDSHALYVVGSDKKLKELEEVGGTGTKVTKELDTGTMVSKHCPASR